MKYYLSLDKPHNKLATEIANTIKEYYPIGLKVYEEDYDKYPGIVKLKESISEHMEDYNSYMKPWKNFLKNLPIGFKGKIYNSGLPHNTSYGGELILEKYEDKSLIRVKKIVFNVSWLGDFYTVYGTDETIIKDEKDGRELFYRAINVITASPYKEFEKGFNYLQQAIEKEFIDYRFVPFYLCCFNIKDLQLPYSEPFDTTVYNAIFSGELDLIHLPSIYLRGNKYYGAEPSNIKVELRRPPNS